MPIAGKVVVSRVKHLIEDIVHRLHQIVPCPMIRGQIDVPLGAPQQALTGDGGQVILVFVRERNKGVRG